jgi:hypothetical protein
MGFINNRYDTKYSKPQGLNNRFNNLNIKILINLYFFT